MSCKKAQGFLEEHGWQVVEQADAKKVQHGREATLELARTARRVLVAKGKNVVAFDMDKGPPDDETLLRHLLGPTGNLRAPTLRKGKTLLVGFNEEVYQQLLPA